MIEFKATKPDVVINLDDTVSVIFKTHKSFLSQYEQLKDTEWLITLKEYKKRRSLSQNAYMWTLLGKLGQVLLIGREELYKTYIKDYGKFDFIPVKNEAVSSFVSAWEKGRVGNFAEIDRQSKIDGYTTLRVYYGSSLYDSKEMAHLIEPIVRDCQDQGISTMTYEEIMLLQNENG